MASSPLQNYLRAYRKRLALSQDEMAFLLGLRSGTNVCRSERFARMPSLEDAFAYELIHGKPARELFSSLYEKVAREVTARAKVLTARHAGKHGRRSVHKCKMLANIGSIRGTTNQPA
jgi:DNA-binding XRE family transcriptional regulator